MVAADFAEPSLHIFSETKMLLMIKVADRRVRNNHKHAKFVKNDHKPAPLVSINHKPARSSVATISLPCSSRATKRLSLATQFSSTDMSRPYLTGYSSTTWSRYRAVVDLSTNLIPRFSEQNYLPIQSCFYTVVLCVLLNTAQNGKFRNESPKLKCTKRHFLNVEHRSIQRRTLRPIKLIWVTEYCKEPRRKGAFGVKDTKARRKMSKYTILTPCKTLLNRRRDVDREIDHVHRGTERNLENFGECQILPTVQLYKRYKISWNGELRWTVPTGRQENQEDSLQSRETEYFSTAHSSFNGRLSGLLPSSA